MTLEEFWEITGELKNARQAMGDDAVVLKLESMTTQELMDYYKIQQKLRQKAFTTEVYEVGSLLYGMPLGDDSINDFTSWLIFMGQEVYEAALTTPDDIATLCHVEPEEDLFGVHSEALDVLYERLEQRELKDEFEQIPLLDDMSEWVEISPDSLKSRYPNLWSEYGDRFIFW